MESLRRIDSLGRIVIPKDIRDNLKIKGDDVLSFLQNGETILLKKHSLFDGLNRSVCNIVNSISSNYKCNCFIANDDVVLASSIKEVVYKKVSNKIIDSIVNRKSFVIKEKLYVTKDYFLEGYSYCFSIVTNGDSIGLLILNSKVDNKELINMGNLITTFLSKEL